MKSTSVLSAVAAVGFAVSLPVAIPGGVAQADPPATPAQDLAGKTIFLDPGHNAPSAEPAALTKQVPDGRGGHKDCQTTGTQTDSGYQEHTFTWAISQLLKTELEQRGAKVLLSRKDDTSDFTCVDERANAENASNADAVVAIHADGAAAGDHGFHVSYSADPPTQANAAEAGQSKELATDMRDALQRSGMTPASYIGTGGLYGRTDLAGLNLATRPSILVELANMRNADEAAAMQQPATQQHYADALATGVESFLHAPSATPTPATSSAPTSEPAATTESAPTPETPTQSAPAPTSSAAAAPTTSTPTTSAPPVTVDVGGYPAQGSSDAPDGSPGPSTAAPTSQPTTSATPTGQDQPASSESPAAGTPATDRTSEPSTGQQSDGPTAHDAASQWGAPRAITTAPTLVYSDVNTGSAVLTTAAQGAAITPVSGFKALVYVHGEKVDGRTTWVYGVFNGKPGWVPLSQLSPTP